VSTVVADYLCNTFPAHFKRTSGVPAASILDQSARAVVEALPGLTSDALRALEKAEQAGKARKTVLRAIAATLEG
jgi:hypothetical protein